MNTSDLQAISSIIGAVGGILGFFTFIDNYILKFNPKFQISNTLFFKFSTNEKTFTGKAKNLSRFFLKIEIFNKRNKIGRIDDFAIRIYDARGTAPSPHMIFAKNLLLKLPRLKQSLKEAETNSFSPISILSKSSAQLTIEFKSDRHTGTYLNPEGDIRVDLLYNCSSRGWQTIGSYNPYYYGVEDDNQDPDGIIEYSLLDSEVSRVKAHKALSEPKIGIYKGVSGKYLGFYFMKPIYFFRRAITYPIKILNLSRILVGIFCSQAFHSCITLPLILSKSKSLPKVSFRPAKTHLIDNTKQALDKIKIHIENLSEKINLGAADRAKIFIHSEGEGFMLSRGNLTIKFYKSGDGYIRANDTDGYPQMFAFSMELTEYPFGVKLWKVNKKTMSLKTACIHIMDSFILLAH